MINKQRPVQKIYHGSIKPSDFARDLISHFHKGNLRVQQVGSGSKITVQISTHRHARSGGQTALSVRLQSVEDGVSVSIGKQAWIGVAASLGFTALSAMRNPLHLLSRIDDIAQDIESLQLTNEVWEVIEGTAISLSAGHQLSERLKRSVCEFCETANAVGESRCIGCGAPMGGAQPITCRHCGYVTTREEKNCPNCGQVVV